MTTHERKMIRQTLLGFDFKKVHDYMESVDWKWSFDDKYRIPTIIELYQKAEDLLTDAVEKKYTHCSGGFFAYSNGYIAELSFTVACSSGELETENNEEQ